MYWRLRRISSAVNLPAKRGPSEPAPEPAPGRCSSAMAAVTTPPPDYSRARPRGTSASSGLRRSQASAWEVVLTPFPTPPRVRQLQLPGRRELQSSVHYHRTTATATAMSTPKANVSSSVTSLSYSILTASLVNASGNVFISPLSIYNALTLALNGAGHGSETHKELLQLLCPGSAHSSYLSYFKSFFSHSATAEVKEEAKLNSELAKLTGVLTGSTSSNADQDCMLLIANGLFTKSALNASYSEQMASLFKATTQQVVDAAAVNAWVQEQTKGEIPTLLEPGAQFDTVLANALYFKGLWQNAFKPMLTRPRTFHAVGGDREVMMMVAQFENENKTQVVTAKGRYKAVMLPYRGLQFAAMAVLPDEGVSLPQALEAMRSGGIDIDVASPNKTMVVMPKFRAESSCNLKEMLQGLGVKAAFTAGADFGRASQGLYIEEVLHKAVVDVDEMGTVAAAATAVMMNRCAPERPVELVFDRPFIFSIQHIATGTPVFYGVVQAPPAAAAKA